MNRTLVLIPYLFLAIILYSCGGKKTSMPQSVGKTAEIVVVTNNQTKWDGKVGETIRTFFDQDFEVLPQPEPLFELANLQIVDFNNSKMFKSHHNIFIIDIDKKSKEAILEVKKDLWSRPQRIIKITAPTDSSFCNFFNEKKEILLSIFMESERERLIRTFKAFKDHDIQNNIRKNFDFTLEVPGGFYIAKKYSNFAWIRKEGQKNSLGIMIYTYDFTDTIAFNPERIISFRNEISKEYIPGPSEGSYMVVDEKFIPVVSKRIDFNGMFAVETRGLWKVEGDFMGGPFVNYTFVDEKKNIVVTLDSYVYAPNAKKRDLLIQMEAILYSIKLME